MGSQYRCSSKSYLKKTYFYRSFNFRSGKRWPPPTAASPGSSPAEAAPTWWWSRTDCCSVLKTCENKTSPQAVISSNYIIVWCSGHYGWPLGIFLTNMPSKYKIKPDPKKLYNHQVRVFKNNVRRIWCKFIFSVNLKLNTLRNSAFSSDLQGPFEK